MVHHYAAEKRLIAQGYKRKYRHGAPRRQTAEAGCCHSLFRRTQIQKGEEIMVKGFMNVADSIAKKGGYSMKSAKAILASSTRKASPAAKKKNPALRKVRMPGKKK